MQVDRFCRKFERILDDHDSYEQNCDPCCYEEERECDMAFRDREGDNRDSRFRRGAEGSAGGRDHRFFRRNGLFIGLIVGVIVALLLLALSSFIRV